MHPAPPVLGQRSRLTVRTPRHSADVVVPTAEPLGEWLPSLLRRVLPAGPETDGGWLLTRIDGEPIDPARSLAELGVPDGEVLYLHPDDVPGPAVVVEDAVEAITRRPRGTVTPELRRALLLPAAALLTVAAAVLVALLGRGSDAGSAGAGPAGVALACCAGALLVVAWVVDRRLDDAAAAALSGLAATVHAALAAALLVPAATPTQGAMTVLAAAMVVQLPLAVLGPWSRAVSTGVLWAAAPSQVGLVVAVATGLGPGAAAGVAACVLALALPAAPRLAGWAAGLTVAPLRRTAPGRDPEAEELPEQVADALRLLPSVLGATCVALPVLWAVILWQAPAPWGPLLVFAGGVAVATQARTLSTARPASALLVTGGLAIIGAPLAVAVTTTVAGIPAAPAALLLLAAAGAALATAVAPPAAAARVGSRRVVRAAELLARIALAPLLFGACGVFGWAAATGSGFGGG